MNIIEKFLNNQEAENVGLEGAMSQINEIKEVLPKDQSKLDVSKLSEKTRKLIMVAAFTLGTTFAVFMPKESEAQTNYGSNIPTTTVNIYNGGPAGGYNGPTYEEQRDHQKVELAAGLFYELFRFIGHSKVDKKHHPKSKPLPSSSVYGPRP